MIDLHAHVLPGYDDGVRSIEEARALARNAADEGVTAIVATPHVRDDYPTTPERMLHGVELLRADFAREGIPVEILPGGEIDLRQVWVLGPDAVGRFALGGSGNWLLLETPYTGWPPELARTVEVLQRRGYRVLLAHPERNAEVQRDPSLLAPLVRAGMASQITAASIDGRLGEAARACAASLLAAGLAHVLATDAHAPEVRAAGLLGAREAVADDGLFHYLTLEVPAAIIAGNELPSRGRG